MWLNLKIISGWTGQSDQTRGWPSRWWRRQLLCDPIQARLSSKQGGRGSGRPEALPRQFRAQLEAEEAGHGLPEGVPEGGGQGHGAGEEEREEEAHREHHEGEGETEKWTTTEEMVQEGGTALPENNPGLRNWVQQEGHQQNSLGEVKTRQFLFYMKCLPSQCRRKSNLISFLLSTILKLW